MKYKEARCLQVDVGWTAIKPNRVMNIACYLYYLLWGF